MRISAPRLETIGSRVRAIARVDWEDCDRPGGDVVFETEAAFAGEFTASPEAFAVICALQARRDGERRLRIDAPLCPQLRDGLAQALSILESWFPAVNRSPQIEAAGGFRVLCPPHPRAASLVSGGIDSIRLILGNRRLFPPDHPRFLHDGLYLYGTVHSQNVPRSALENLVERQRRCVEGICRLAGLRLLPVSVDLRVLADDRPFVLSQGHGARLAAVAHLFKSVSRVSIAASFFAGDLFPWGSHPLLDPCFGSSSLEVLHEGIHFRRLESVRALLDWPEVLPLLMVCGEAPIDSDFPNCGRCEKCVRTMLELDVAGGLEAATSFPQRRITVEDIEILSPQFWVPPYWKDLVEPLCASGRRDLVAAVGRLIDRAERHRDWLEEKGLKGRIRRLDRRHLSGRLAAALRALRRIRG
jgi:hypothetical protein